MLQIALIAADDAWYPFYRVLTQHGLIVHVANPYSSVLARTLGMWEQADALLSFLRERNELPIEDRLTERDVEFLAADLDSHSPRLPARSVLIKPLAGLAVLVGAGFLLRRAWQGGGDGSAMEQY